MTRPWDGRTRITLLRIVAVLALASAATPIRVSAQANGNLQLHFMDVGQGDGTLLISPKGETVLFDDGVLNNCGKPQQYLEHLGLAGIDYLIVSHYHADHIGCTRQLLDEFPLRKAAYDRGGSYGSASYAAYEEAVGQLRHTATTQTTITLDQGEPVPVSVKIVAVNGNGIQSNDENDRSVVAVVQCGDFSAVIGGDLSGYTTDKYRDIETSVASKVGQVDVYKVHHHGSSHSTNETWLQTVRPMIGIISTGEGNSYAHPTGECLERLHAAGVRTYWTSGGNGAPPDPTFDIVAGSTIVETVPGSTTFTVLWGGTHHATYSALGQATNPVTDTKYVWSTNSSVYHFANCGVSSRIADQNRQEGDTPPVGKRLHKGCPQQ